MAIVVFLVKHSLVYTPFFMQKSAENSYFLHNLYITLCVFKTITISSYFKETEDRLTAVRDMSST